MTFAQLLRRRSLGENRVLPVELQDDRGVRMSRSPCAMASGSTTGLSAPAFRAHQAMRQWLGAVNEGIIELRI